MIIGGTTADATVRGSSVRGSREVAAMRRESIEAPRRGRPHKVPTRPWIPIDVPLRVGGASADMAVRVSHRCAQAQRRKIHKCIILVLRVGGARADGAMRSTSGATDKCRASSSMRQGEVGRTRCRQALDVDRCIAAGLRHGRLCGNERFLGSLRQCGACP